MFNFFDYLYYRACEFYEKKEGGLGFTFTGVLVVCAMYLFNILTIFFGISLFINKKIVINKYYAIILALALLVINIVRYNKYDYDMLKKNWMNEEESKKKKHGYWIVVYIVLSTVLVFGLAIYSGSKKTWN